MKHLKRLGYGSLVVGGVVAAIAFFALAPQYLVIGVFALGVSYCVGAIVTQ